MQRKGVRMAAEEGQQTPFDWGILFSMIACVCLGAGLFLFIRNNDLLANGAQNLRHPEALIMLAVLGIPFVLMLLHLIRTLLPWRTSRAVQRPAK
jgi:hypothetical protein